MSQDTTRSSSLAEGKARFLINDDFLTQEETKSTGSNKHDKDFSSQNGDP